MKPPQLISYCKRFSEGPFTCDEKWISFLNYDKWNQWIVSFSLTQPIALEDYSRPEEDSPLDNVLNRHNVYIIAKED
ncbi:hypothetical protein BpHYR1_043656 [Brachionus plicatilis]|uniref:Uncharacterized protein n=1 Tax=Brachionus plicatilis TaxID=10195 RepID=A0A3M7P945_BRAPC|nr:hypothetical protein BpHYR1_043656 [Brachionus plicatilis]